MADPDPTIEDELLVIVRELFSGKAGAEDPPPVSDETPGNHVPREGNNPSPAAGDDLKAFTRALFDPTTPLI